ncbi:MAG: class I SAM-dependent methyltransferase [Nitrospirota bacterium]
MGNESPLPSPLATPQPWSLVADAYTAELLSQFELFARDALRLAELPRSPRIVDVATGPGTLALIAAQDHGAQVSAIDFSPVMIEHLQRRAKQVRLASIDVRVGDGQALPFADDAYDGAFSMFGLMFFPDRAAGFRELRRVLRPGRRAVVGSWAPLDGAFALVMDGIRAMLPDLPFGDGKGPLSDPEEFRAEMTAAGFRDATVHTVTHPFSIPSLTEFWGVVQRTTAPVVLLRRKLGEERWADVGRGVFDRLRSALGDGPVTVSGVARLGVGVK